MGWNYATNFVQWECEGLPTYLLNLEMMGDVVACGPGLLAGYAIV